MSPELKEKIDEFHKLVDSKDHSSPKLFYTWRELKPLIEKELNEGA